MEDQNAPVHEHDHAEPTVIHHPEEDMTVLARWLQRGLEKGARFWLLLGGVTVLGFALSAIVSGLLAGRSTGDKAWIEVAGAQGAKDLIKIAEDNPESPASISAKLQAAIQEYISGMSDLTNPMGKTAAAGPRLETALRLFREVAKEAPKGSSPAIAAEMGIARTLETRNELPDAIAQYKRIAEVYPDAPEAKEAQELAKVLEDPENATFYKELYAYKPPATPAIDPRSLDLGPGGSINFPGVPGSLLKSLTPEINVPAGLDAPPSSPTEPKIVVPPVDPPKADGPKLDAPKADAPATVPNPTPAPPEPPKDPAAPKEKGE